MSRLRKFIIKNDARIHRLLEILPGFVSWNIILFPYWGIFVIPEVVAYTILAYNIYWFYQSLQLAGTGLVSHFRIQASMGYDWVKDLKSFPDWKKVRHLVIIPTFKEPLHTLQKTLRAIANQTLPKSHIYVILATEKKEDEKDRKMKVETLKKEFGEKLPNFFVTEHELVPGEVAGKSSNERHAAVWAKKNIIDKKGFDMNYVVATSCDADHRYHKNHFASLTFKFLDDPQRYKRFWQPVILFYNNIWRLPAITRVVNTLSSLGHMSFQPRKDKLINVSNYSLSFKLLHGVGYWDPDKIPEDYNIFFKSYYKMGGGIEVEPLYLPVYADAAEGETLFQTLKNEYEQKKRWAWGASDDPWIIKNYLLTPGVPFWEKTMRLLFVMQTHFLWPVHFFLLSIGLQIPVLLNPRFAKTTLGYMVPRLSRIILGTAAAFLVSLLIINKKYKPKKPDYVPAWRAFLSPFEFLLMPIAGFFFSALPGLDAHTRLMLGKYIEYRVTEKV